MYRKYEQNIQKKDDLPKRKIIYQKERLMVTKKRDYHKKTGVKQREDVCMT